KERKREEAARRKKEREEARKAKEEGREPVVTPTPEGEGEGVTNDVIAQIQAQIAELEAKILQSAEVKPADIAQLEALNDEAEAAQQQELLTNIHPMDVQMTDDRAAVAISGSIEGLGDICRA
ncbi:hypothetical protein BSN82_17510, partial [Acinetobacter baylyi]|uniref:hypothetical protein n=1 Tax=Acinetobacter baylyi TaxID=202950 RepID=UPI001C087A7E